MELIIFQIIVLIMSAIVHEYAHGWAAFQQGDPTAKDEGRLTLNPLKHLDPVGSFLLPLIMVVSRMPFVFGYAKPVPYNPYNLKNQKYGPAIVAIAGPLANFITALIFGLILRFILANPGSSFASQSLVNLLDIIVYINLILMIFNLVPIPPLDGSKVLMPFLPYNWQLKLSALEPYGMFIVFAFIMVGFSLIMPLVSVLYRLIVGMV